MNVNQMLEEIIQYSLLAMKHARKNNTTTCIDKYSGHWQEK